MTHWKRPWCWKGLGAGGKGHDRGWDDWMVSPTRCTWVWVNSRSWWWTGRSGVLRFMGSQRVRHDWATELNWTKLRAANTKTGYLDSYLHPEECGSCLSPTASILQRNQLVFSVNREGWAGSSLLMSRGLSAYWMVRLLCMPSPSWSQRVILQRSRTFNKKDPEIQAFVSLPIWAHSITWLPIDLQVLCRHRASTTLLVLHPQLKYKQTT